MRDGRRMTGLHPRLGDCKHVKLPVTDEVVDQHGLVDSGPDVNTELHAGGPGSVSTPPSSSSIATQMQPVIAGIVADRCNHQRNAGDSQRVVGTVTEIHLRRRLTAVRSHAASPTACFGA